MSLNKLRSQIDRADKQIVRLLNQRARIIRRVADQKKKENKSVYCPDREQAVLRSVARANTGPLSNPALAAIYREIMSASLAMEKQIKIAFLGPEATFTHQASLKRFGTQVEYLSCDSIAAVFAEVEKGNADYGVVPIENSVEGAVSHTLDMFVESDLKICSQVMLPISHHLLARCRREQVAQVYSNPMVFGQCRIWLQRHMPGVECVEVSSTTRAAQIAARQKNAAAIAGILAAELYRLDVLARNIEDSPHIFTRFLVIGKTDAPVTGHDRTSLLVSIKDKVGALHDILAPFRKYRVNLSKIESRPSKKRAWDYYFFIDLEGHKDQPRIKRTLAELEERSKFLKILGSYPVGE